MAVEYEWGREMWDTRCGVHWRWQRRGRRRQKIRLYDCLVSMTGNSDISGLNDDRNKWMARGMKVGSVIYPMPPKPEVKQQNDAGREGQMRMEIYIRALGKSVALNRKILV
jgi:hypothetical protein